MKFEWEIISGEEMGHEENGTMTFRAKTIGGWLVNSYTWGGFDQGCESMVFVPDAKHEWEITK
jgi:hypothetical protein